ncbi:hypothetical protein KY359_00925 [Candidatus Woesearchaeota archaeon]|nr:hypothetical protein [Candidatus Woesearchaeota archaeon]
MAEGSKAKEIKEKVKEYSELVEKIAAAANTLQMGRLIETVNSKSKEMVHVGLMTDAHMLLKNAGELEEKGKKEKAKKMVSLASTLVSKTPVHDAVFETVAKRMGHIGERLGMIPERPPQAPGATEGPARVERAGEGEKAREGEPSREGERRKDDKDKIPELIAASARYLTAGDYDEAAKTLGTARGIAVKENLHELQEEIEDRAKKIEEKRKAAEKLKGLDELFEKNIFLSPEKVKKAALELVSVEINSPEDMNRIDELIEDKAGRMISETKEAIADAISSSDSPDTVKERVKDSIDKAKEELSKLGDSLPGRMGKTRQILYGGAIPDLSSDEEKKAYFISKLDMILSKIKEDVLK